MNVTSAASYIRTDSSLPTREEQLAAVERLAARKGFEIVARYEDLEAPGEFLYHKPALREAINNIQELEEWQVLLAADPRCFSETPSARHELIHKFSLYGNRLECPEKDWESFEAGMKSYRREMSGR